MILEKTLCLEAYLFSIFSPIQEDLYDASFIKRFFFYNQNNKCYLLKKKTLDKYYSKNILFGQKYFVKQFLYCIIFHKIPTSQV